MPNKTLYIRDSDEAVWKRAEDHAARTRLSLSQVVTTALDRFLPPDPGGIIVNVGLGDSLHQVRFTGRWLVDPQHDRVQVPHRFCYYGVALTGRGRIAVLAATDDLGTPDSLSDYDDLDQAAADGVPPDVIGRAATALGRDPVIWRDI